MASTVLITGGTGFTGGFLVEIYASLGWAVHATSLGRDAWGVGGREASIHRVDLRDAAGTLRVVERVKPHIVHHLAGQTSVRRSWEEPAGTIAGNAVAQLNVLEAVRRCNRDARVIVVGSCEEYGCPAPDRNPLTEDAELRPVSPYAASKVAQDLMGLQYAASFGMDVVRVRPFLQLGPRRSERFVAGGFARQVAEIRIGTRPGMIDVGAIDLVRDFTDVRDVARALVALGESGRSGEVYNIASGSGHTLRDLLSTMISASGIRAEIRSVDTLRRSGEPAVMIGDYTRLHSTTGWKPEITFEQSAVDTYGYWLDRLTHEKGK